MAALTTSKKNPQFDDPSPIVKSLSLPMKANTKALAGGLAAIDSAGNAMPATPTAGGTVRVIGVFQEEVDNSTGLAGAKRVATRRGAFSFKNSTAGDAITAAEVGALVFAVDDQTVAKTDGGAGARKVAGACLGLDDNGTDVIVEVGVHLG